MEVSVDQTALAAEVRALVSLNIDQLRDEWRRRFRTPPPRLRGPDLMRRALADRIQSEALGRDLEVEQKLATLVRAHGRGEAPKAPRPISTPAR